MHQSLRDLKSDQFRMGDDIDREIRRRDRYFNVSTCPKPSCLLLITNTLCENAHIHTVLCFLPLERTDIETKKTLENFAGHIKASQKEEPVSAANVT